MALDQEASPFGGMTLVLVGTIAMDKALKPQQRKTEEAAVQSKPFRHRMCLTLKRWSDVENAFTVSESSKPLIKAFKEGQEAPDTPAGTAHCQQAAEVPKATSICLN